MIFITISVNLLQSFLEIGHPLFEYFLPKEYAIAIPSFLLATGLVVVGIFIGTVMIKEGRKAKISEFDNR